MSVTSAAGGARPTVVDMGLLGRVPVHNLYEMYLETQEAGVYLTVYQTKAARSLGGWVYDSAACLAKYMESALFEENHCPGGLKGKHVMELGAGTGIVGIVTGYHGSDVTITDLEPLVPLIQFNIDQNSSLMKGKVVARSLKWGEDTNDFVKPDILVLANCVYYEGSLEALLETCLGLCGERTSVLAAYEEKSADIKKLISKWHKLAGEHFNIEDVPRSHLSGEHVTDYGRVVVMRRKA